VSAQEKTVFPELKAPVVPLSILNWGIFLSGAASGSTIY
jgi:hypothetical protein